MLWLLEKMSSRKENYVEIYGNGELMLLHCGITTKAPNKGIPAFQANTIRWSLKYFVCHSFSIPLHDILYRTADWD